MRLESTSICQLRCPSCRTTTGMQPARGSGYLPFEHFKRLLERSPFVRRVELCSAGELFLNPQLLRILEHAHAEGIELSADSGVNLNTVSDELLEALVRYRVRRITVSIDGATPESYARYRVGGDLERVLDNIGKLNRLKAKHRSKFPLLTWQFIPFGHNEYELPRARRMAADLGMHFTVRLSWDDTVSPVKDRVFVRREAGIPPTRSGYHSEFGVDYYRPCYQLWSAPQINWDGKLLGCDHNYWDEFGGNAIEDGVAAVLDGERIRYARAMLMGQAKARDDVPCSRCSIFMRIKQSELWISAAEIRTRTRRDRLRAWLAERAPRLLRAARAVDRKTGVLRALQRMSMRHGRLLPALGLAFVLLALAFAAGALLARRGDGTTTTKAAAPATDAPIDPSKLSAPVDPAALLRVLRRYGDVMIASGQDHYGRQRSPLLASTLDRRTRALPRNRPLKVSGVRADDRCTSGANVMHDQNLYRLLYRLSEITQQPKYARQADRALGWFFTHTQSNATGLMPWGEHLCWDFRKEQVVGHGDKHELFRPWALWQRTYSLAPRAARAFAVGLWRHQIRDHKRGRFSRHARFSRHGPGSGHEYPRHGGFYIEAWAQAYARGETLMLRAIGTLVDYFSKVQTTAGAIPAGTNRRNRGRAWSYSQLSLAISLHKAASLLPQPLAEKMRRLAARSDQFFLALPHLDGGHGFVTTSHIDAPRAMQAHRPYSHPWRIAYGEFSDANLALHCVERFVQTKDPRFRALVLRAGNRYLKSDPDWTRELYPEAFAGAIKLLVEAHRMQKGRGYLARARKLASYAIALFWGDNPLPRASSRVDHYETITRADSLAIALLALWSELSTYSAPLRIEFIDR